MLQEAMIGRPSFYDVALFDWFFNKLKLIYVSNGILKYLKLMRCRRCHSQSRI